MSNRLLLLPFMLLFALSIFSQNKPCSAESFRAFDYWIGDWRVVNAQNGSFAGYSSIEIMLDSCVLLENWMGAGGSIGKSFNHYDVSTGKWKQKWVDNVASNIEFEGKIVNDTANFYSKTISQNNGKIVYSHMMIAKVSEDVVHQLWRQSYDSIKWGVAFDGKYHRIPSVLEARTSVNIDSVYIQFSQAYKELKPELVSDLYHDNAFYLSGNEQIQEGKEYISNNFAGFFNQIAKRNQTMDISFHIVDRQIDKNLVADIGYFLLTYYDTEGKPNESAGKFSTVLKPDSVGNWKFISDSYNPAPVAEVKKLIK